MYICSIHHIPTIVTAFWLDVGKSFGIDLATVQVKVLVMSVPLMFVDDMAAVVVPRVRGLPDTSPVTEFRVSPVGRAPDDTVQVIGFSPCSRYLENWTEVSLCALEMRESTNLNIGRSKVSIAPLAATEACCACAATVPL